MFYSDCIKVLKLCLFFLKVMLMAIQVILFDSRNMAFKTFRLKVTNKKAFSTKTNISRIEVSLLKLQFFKAGVYFRNFSTYREK